MFAKSLVAGALLAVITAPAAADVFFFEDPIAFRDFNQTHGKLLKGVETFEEAVVDPGGKITLYDPLQSGIPNPPGGVDGFPQGLAEPNIIIQTNLTPGPNPPDPNPTVGDPTALYVIGPGFNGEANSKKVGEDLFLQNVIASLDLIFTEPNHTGVGFWLSRFTGFPTGGWHITVYDKTDTDIGKFIMPAPASTEPEKIFFGVWSDLTIGRINIYDLATDDLGNPIWAPDAVDDIEMWVPEPGTLALLALGGLAVLRRRPR